MMNPSQYLHYQSDYLQPLPTSLDIKKSPLALLAQTCSSIGKDVVPTKASVILQDRKDTEKDKPTSVDKTPQMSPTLKKDSSKDNDKPGFRTVPPKDIPPLVPIANDHTRSPSSDQKLLRESSPNLNTRPLSVSSKGSPISKHSVSNVKEHDHQEQRDSRNSPMSHPKPSPNPSPYSQANSYGTIKPNCHPLYSGLHASHHMGYPGFPMHSLSPEVAAIYQSQLFAHSGGLHTQGVSASVAAAAAHQSALKAGAAAASMSQYVNYTRIRTPSGATTLVPVCKDPYCTNCQLTVQTSHSSTTCKTPACSQCAHEKALLGLSASASGYGLHTNPLSLYPHLATHPSSATGLSSLHSLYPHSAIPAAHQGGLPYVCNWVAGHDYCGKRFNSSEELMTHLRSHTSSLESGLPMNYGLSLQSALAASSVGLGGGLGGSAPISPNSLRRAGYPTSLSPGLLSSSRFHPYKSPLSAAGVPPSASHLPPMSAYYPAYQSLYGPRLGAAVP